MLHQKCRHCWAAVAVRVQWTCNLQHANDINENVIIISPAQCLSCAQFTQHTQLGMKRAASVRTAHRTLGCSSEEGEWFDSAILRNDTLISFISWLGRYGPWGWYTRTREHKFRALLVCTYVNARSCAEYDTLFWKITSHIHTHIAVRRMCSIFVLPFYYYSFHTNETVPRQRGGGHNSNLYSVNSMRTVQTTEYTEHRYIISLEYTYDMAWHGMAWRWCAVRKSDWISRVTKDKR